MRHGQKPARRARRVKFSRGVPILYTEELMRKIAFIVCALAAALALSGCRVSTLVGMGTGTGDGTDKVYTLTFNPKNGEDPQIQKALEGATILLPETPSPARTSCEFLGWYDSITERTYPPGHEYLVDKDITFTGQWGEIANITFVFPADDPRQVNGEYLYRNMAVYRELNGHNLPDGIVHNVKVGSVYILPQKPSYPSYLGEGLRWKEQATGKTHEFGAEFTVPENYPKKDNYGNAFIWFELVVQYYNFN